MTAALWDDMPACHDLAHVQLFDAPRGQKITPEDRDRYELAAVLCATCPMLERCATDTTVQQSDGFRHGVLFTRDRNGKPAARNLNPPKRDRTPRRPLTSIERTHKECPRCELDQPIDGYALDRTRTDGRSAYCKSCRAVLTRKQRSAA